MLKSTVQALGLTSGSCVHFLKCPHRMEIALRSSNRLKFVVVNSEFKQELFFYYTCLPRVFLLDMAKGFGLLCLMKTMTSFNLLIWLRNPVYSMQAQNRWIGGTMKIKHITCIILWRLIYDGSLCTWSHPLCSFLMGRKLTRMLYILRQIMKCSAINIRAEDH